MLPTELRLRTTQSSTWQAFVVKDEVVKMLGVASHAVSVQLLISALVPQKAATDNTEANGYAHVR